MAEDRVEAVEKALIVLNCFSKTENRISLADLSKKTGFYKSTLLRLLKSLERFGYIKRDDNGHYALGLTLARLGAMVHDEFDMEGHIRPVLEKLRDGLNETASFYIREGNVRVCLYRVNANRAMRHHLDEGVHFPLGQGAAGKLLSAYLDCEDEQGSDIRNQGYAMSHGERDPDIAAIAVPIFKEDGRVLGALNISGLIHHFDEAFKNTALENLRKEAKGLEVILGQA